MKRACMSFEGCRGTGFHNDMEDSGSGREVWCGCAASFCMDLAHFDAGRGDETHCCHLRPKHEGDHSEGSITWENKTPGQVSPNRPEY